MTTQKKIILGLVALVVAVIVLIFFTRPATTPLYSTKSTLADTTLGRWDDETVIFSNSRALVTYNLNTKVSRPITADAKLPTIIHISVSGDKRYVLMQATSPQYDDVFGAQLATEPPTEVVPVWWVYDTQTKLYLHLSPQVSLAQFGDDDTIYALANDSGTSRIQTYQMPAPQPTKELKTKSYVNFAAIGDSGEFYGQTLDNNIDKVTAAGSKTILKKAGGFSLSADSKFAITVAQKASKNNLTSLWVTNLQKNKTTQIGEQEEGGALWAASGSTLVYSSKEKLHRRDFLSGGRDYTYKIDGLKYVGEISPTAYLSNDFIFAHTSNGTYLLSRQKTTLPAVPSTYSKTLADDTSIVFVPKENAFLVTVFGQLTPEKKTAVYKQLLADNINPDLITVRFSNVILSGSHP